jgi:polyphosphate kinase
MSPRGGIAGPVGQNKLLTASRVNGLCHLQEWVKEKKLRVIILFEGRDAAVEYVMGFVEPDEHKRFPSLCPQVEKYIVDAGIILIKIWLEVGMEEQERRFKARIDDPLRQWKLSPMDTESYRRWYEYSRARDMMFKATSSKHAPWNIIRSDDKRRARLNCIAHLLKIIPYDKVSRDQVRLPRRSDKGRYNDQALRGVKFVAERY